MKKLIILVAWLIFTQEMFAQAEVYATYNEYKNTTGTKYEGNINYRPNFVSGRKNNNYQPYLEIKNGKEKSKVELINDWGFKYKGILFVKDTNSDLYYALLSEGKLYYWENAIIIFQELDDVWYNTQNVNYGRGSYISTDINLPTQYYELDKKNAFSSTYTVKYNELFKLHPELQPFLDCIGENKKAVPLLGKINDNMLLFETLSSNVNTDKLSKKQRNLIRNCIKSLNGNFNKAILIQ
jgi:hypothetical protein